MKITKPIGLVNAFRVSQREYHHFQPHREKESWNVLSFRKGKKKKRKKKKGQLKEWNFLQRAHASLVGFALRNYV